MSVAAKLFPIGVLALFTGCSPASDGHAAADAEGRSGQITAAEPVSPPLPPRSPAPILPEIDPVVAGHPAADARPTADTNAPVHAGTRLPPMKPSVVDIPPPAYVPDLPQADGTADPTPFPDEVTHYMVDRDSCDHFRGEEAYDAERLAYLQENIAELCTGTDARLAMLRQRYANDPAVMSALSGYENRIEGNASQ